MPDWAGPTSAPLWAVVVAGAGAGAAGTALVRAIARRTGFVNEPNPIVPQHDRPVAYLGGVGVALGLAAVLAWGAAAGEPVGLKGLGLGAALFCLLGVVDDARALRPAHKLAAQLVVSAIAVGGGLTAPVTGAPAVDAALSVLWIAGVVNAVNFTDVCDGLVAGLAAVGLFALAVLVPALQVPALATAGACLGFLLFNRPPATIFLGDAGSHLLGFLLAGGGIVLFRGAPTGSSALAAVLIVAVPAFEFVFLFWVRVRKGLPWWRGSPDHFSLRLQAAGCSRGGTDAIAWGAAALLAGVAVSLESLPPGGRLAVLPLLVAGAGLSGWKLLPWEVDSPRAVAPPPGDRCGLCDAAGVRRIYDLGELRVGVCGSCGTGRVLGLGTPEAPTLSTEDYARAYAAERTDGKADDCHRLFVEHGPAPRPGATLLDLGCGRGEFLDLAREDGWRTLGVEISHDGASRAEASGHRVVQGSVLDPTVLGDDRADAVVLWDLLEHLESPRRALENIAGWLRPGGSVALLTPHMGSAYDRIGSAAYAAGARSNALLRMCWSAAHLYRFSPEGLEAELARLGFVDVRLRPVLLLSLRADKYAGGAILASWTGVPAVDALISRGGVSTARLLRIRNKVLVTARKETA